MKFNLNCLYAGTVHISGSGTEGANVLELNVVLQADDVLSHG
jgi:hypothetical protein